MRLDNLLWVSGGDRGRLWPKLRWLSLGVAVGVSALIFFLALVTGLQGLILTRILGMVPDQLEVVPATVSVGPLQFQSGGTLDAATLNRLRGLPGVAALYRRARLAIPSELTARYSGFDFVTDIIIEGVDDGLLHDDFGATFSLQPDGQPAPAVLAGTMLDMLNAGLSVHVGGPALSRTALVGTEFNLLIGRSSFHQGPATPFPCKLIGISDRAVVSGPTLPYAYLERWDREVGGPPLTVYAAVLQLTGSDRLQAVATRTAALGLRAPKQEQAVWISGAAQAVEVGLVCFCAVLLIVAGVGIANGLGMMVQEERTDIGLMRALGARRRDIQAIFLLRALMVGLIGSLSGIGVGLGGVGLATRLVFHWLPTELLNHSPLLQVTVGSLVGPFLFGVFASVAAGMVPARQAAALHPADALRGV